MKTRTYLITETGLLFANIQRSGLSSRTDPFDLVKYLHLHFADIDIVLKIQEISIADSEILCETQEGSGHYSMIPPIIYLFCMYMPIRYNKYPSEIKKRPGGKPGLMD